MRRYMAGLYNKKVLFFDGVSNRVVVPYSDSLFVDRKVTVGVLAKLWKVPESDWQLVACYSDFAILSGSEGGTGVHASILTTAGRFVTAGFKMGFDWHSIFLVFDADLPSDNLKLYVDGKLVDAVDAPYPIADVANKNIGVGANPGGSYFTPTIIASVYVYNRVLPDKEIARVKNDAFNLRPASVRDGLVLELLPDTLDCENNVWYDNSGHGNHGTIYGARCVAV